MTTDTVAVEFLAGPLDGYASRLTTAAAPELPLEWWPKPLQTCGFYELTVEDHGDHNFYLYLWHEAGRT